MTSAREKKIYYRVFTFSIEPKIWSFHGVVFQRTTKKLTRMYNVRADRNFYLINPQWPKQKSVKVMTLRQGNQQHRHI